MTARPPYCEVVYMSEKGQRATTSVNYIGEVTIRNKIGDKDVVFHGRNGGLPPLFRLMAKAMAGYDTTGDKLMWIDLRHSDDGVIYTTNLNKPVPITQRMFMQDGDQNWVTRITAAISVDSLINPIQPSPAYPYRLYVVSTGGSDMAYFNVEDVTPLTAIQASTQALVEWNLRFVNAAQPSTNETQSAPSILQ